MKLFFASIALALLITGCSTTTIHTTQQKIPSYLNSDGTKTSKGVTLSTFRLANYTNTPRAGMRVANLFQGILVTKGFKITSHIADKLPTKEAARAIALKDGSRYFTYGGVSEWRYKTGIDGEPAVSIVCSIYETKNSNLVWSATGSDNDWGNGSLGQLAQELLDQMLGN